MNKRRNKSSKSVNLKAKEFVIVRPRKIFYFISFCSGMLLTLIIVHLITNDSIITEISHIPSLSELLSFNSEEIEQVDIALMNLICTQGLIGSEDLDIDQCLGILDEWADLVHKDTNARLPAYYQNPQKYHNSVNKFKCANLILTLKNTLKMDYNLEIMQTTDFLDSKNFFIHGCLTGKKQGGCISIPITCVAVGRRLGYPLKLALTREHVFFRWEDDHEVFNMEACCPGCDSHPDEYYQTWPNKLTDADVALYGYLKSLTPAEELALFLDTRGHCLLDSGNITEALMCYAQAYLLMPDAPDLLAHLNQAVQQEYDKFQKLESNLKQNKNVTVQAFRPEISE